MGLDVSVPDPPELGDETDLQEYDDVEVRGDTDYRRSELETFLRDGAWAQAFGEWTEHTDLDEAEYDIVRDLALLREFDFFWDDTTHPFCDTVNAWCEFIGLRGDRL